MNNVTDEEMNAIIEQTSNKEKTKWEEKLTET